MENTIIKTSWCFISGLIGMVLILSNAFADAPWTLEATLEAVNQYNPSLAASRAQHGIAQGSLVQAKTFPAPLLNFEVAPIEQTYRPVDISTTIQTGGKRRLQIHIAKAEINATDATIQAMAWRIREDTEQAFYDYAIAQTVQTVMRDYQQVAEQLLDISRKRQAVGDVSGLDVLRAEAAVDDILTQLPPVTTHVDEARRQINILLGRKLDAPFEITTPLSLQMAGLIPFTPMKGGFELPPSLAGEDRLKGQNPPFIGVNGIRPQTGLNQQKTVPLLPKLEFLMLQATTHRLEYAQNKADLSTQQYKLKLAQAGWWPNIQVGTALSMVPQNTRSFWGDNFMVGPAFYAQIPITLVDHQQGPQAIAKASIHQLEFQKYALDSQVAQELNMAYSNLDSSAKQLQLFIATVLPRQQEIVQTSQRSYALGFIDLTAAITAQQTALSARINALQTLSRYYQARVDVERAVGEPLDYDHLATGLSPSNSPPVSSNHRGISSP